MFTKTRQGFTLYELMITLAILMIIAILLPPLFSNFNKLYIYQQNLAQAHIQNQFAIDFIAEETRQAKGILTSHTINTTLYVTTSTVAVLEYPVFNANGHVVPGETDYGVLYLDSTDPTDLKFSLEVSANSAREDTDRTIAQDVSSLIFRYNTSDVASTTVLTTLITVEKTLGNVTADFTQTSAFSLRNQ